MDKKYVLQVIDAKLQQAQALMNECTELSDKYGVVFQLPWGGEGSHQRGMGATYVPPTATESDKEFYSDYMCKYHTDGWMSSAGTC